MIDGYSICFNEWALDKSIKSDLGLLMIISSLTAEYGYCFASNEYLADLFEIDEVSISRKIKKLERKNYLTIEYEREGAKIINRKIRLTKILTGDKQKSQSTINKNVKDNNINNSNNTSNNILYIVDYLNEKAKTSYRATTEKTKRLINARLNEMFTVEDFKKVIDNKVVEWKGTDFEKYLRPETLFGTKFEGYLNEKTKKRDELVEKVDKTIIGGIRL